MSGTNELKKRRLIAEEILTVKIIPSPRSQYTSAISYVSTPLFTHQLFNDKFLVNSTDSAQFKALIIFHTLTLATTVCFVGLQTDGSQSPLHTQIMNELQKGLPPDLRITHTHINFGDLQPSWQIFFNNPQWEDGNPGNKAIQDLIQTAWKFPPPADIRSAQPGRPIGTLLHTFKVPAFKCRYEIFLLCGDDPGS